MLLRICVDIKAIVDGNFNGNNRKEVYCMNGISSTPVIKKAGTYAPLFKQALDMSNTEKIPDKIKPLTGPVDTSDWQTVDTSYEGV